MIDNTQRSWTEGRKLSRTVNSSFEADLVTCLQPIARNKFSQCIGTNRYDLYMCAVLHEQVDAKCHSLMSRT